MKRFYLTLMLPIIAFTTPITSCKKKADDQLSVEPKLRVQLNVDPTQERLGNLGTPASLPDTHAAQNPAFNLLSAHYFELAPTANTLLGDGAVIYHAPETTAGGENAIDFAKSIVKKPGEVWIEVPLSEIEAGTYEWVRLSLSYQNYDITFHYQDQPYTATLASFVGFNQYITSYNLGGETVNVNENRKQGYWGFKSIGGVQTGQAPEGATTVPNPIWNTSPIPAGSCVVTGAFDSPLTITGEETEDIVLTMSLSTNQSFEWYDKNGNGKWDVDNGDEPVMDMGLRGLKPKKD